MGILRKLAHVLSIGLVLIAPILHLLFKLGFTKETVTVTKYSFNPLILFVVFILVMALGLWLLIGTIIKWWKQIKDEPFGSFSVMIFSILIFTFLAFVMWMLNILIHIIENNTQSLITALESYIHEFQWVLGYVFIGGLISIALQVFKK